MPYRSSRLEASEGCCKVSSSLTVLDTKKCSLGNRQTKKLETRSHFLRFKHRRKQGGYHCFTPMNGGGSDWRRLGERLGWERERCGDNGGHSCIVAAAAWLVTVFGLHPVRSTPAWFAHFAIEHNKPVALEHPAWPISADLLMFSKWLSGNSTMNSDARVSRTTKLLRRRHWNDEAPYNQHPARTWARRGEASAEARHLLENALFSERRGRDKSIGVRLLDSAS